MALSDTKRARRAVDNAETREAMRLYAGYDMLRTNDGPSAAAYAALRRACDRLTTVVVAKGDDRGELERLSGQRDTPVLVTDDGRVYTGARAIAAFAGGRCG